VADFSSKDDAWFAEWTARWDAMQDAYFPNRRRVFRLIAEALADRFPQTCRVADLGAGAGTLAEEILNRVPGSTVLCLDVEPFLLEACNRRLRPFADRARVTRADFRKKDFATDITENTESKTDEKFEAVVSSTTLHWFGREILRKIYAWASSMLVKGAPNGTPGGLFLNADHIQPDDPDLARLALDLNEAERACLFQQTGALTWDEFWHSLEEAIGIASYYDNVACPAWGEQDGPEPGHPFSVHADLLRRAGFRHIATLWRHLSDAVLAAET
jgi:hypothetical protein